MRDAGTIPAPIFHAQSRTVDLSAIPNFQIARLLAITNLTARQDIYLFGDDQLGFTAADGAVLTLACDTRPMNDTDVLAVTYEDGTLPLPTGAATSAKQDAGNTILSNLSTGLGTPSDVAPGTDAAAGSLIAKVTRLLGTQSGIATVLAAVRDRLPAALVGGRLSVDGSAVTQPVSVVAAAVTADMSGTLAPGGTATPVAANLTRQFIEITNTGANPLGYRWGAAATATVGHILGAGQSVRYDAKVPTAALNLFSTAGTTFFVTTG